MNACIFVEYLSDIDLKGVFNPYKHLCQIHDLSDGPSLRRANLIQYLKALEVLEVDTIWMGRDLGYKGGRRTGLALTDEYHLPHLNSTYGAKVSKATKGPVVAERTAAEIWSVIVNLKNPPLLWNVFPFHPHEPQVELSNRKFTRRELNEVNDLNHELISWLRIKKIVCIGRDAATYASAFDVKLECVRHPSYGGVKEFRKGIRALYEQSTRQLNLNI